MHPGVPQCQVCGDDRSLVPVQALIHTVEHLRRRKGIDQLRSQIIDDQKVTVQDISGPSFASSSSFPLNRLPARISNISVAVR